MICMWATELDVVHALISQGATADRCSPTNELSEGLDSFPIADFFFLLKIDHSLPPTSRCRQFCGEDIGGEEYGDAKSISYYVLHLNSLAGPHGGHSMGREHSIAIEDVQYAPCKSFVTNCVYYKSIIENRS